MRVLLTGANGHLGDLTLRELTRQGHRVRCFIRKKEAAKQLQRIGKKGQVEIALGDMRDSDALARACADQEVVVHLAAVLPPVSDQQPEMARAVNVGGTQTLIQKLVYASTVAVFGDTQAQQPPRRVGDPLHPMDPYSQHKAECEALLADSGLTYTVLRMSAIPRYDEGFDEMRIRAMFAIPPSDRMECIYPEDAALALANAVSSPAVWGRTLIVSGSKSCQMTFADYYRGYLDAAGIGTFDPKYFGTEHYHLDWYDTAESEALLHYQRHSFADFTREVRRRQRLTRIGVFFVRPFVRAFLLRYSPRH
jgi:uncharacterized protein YbjT (DUF2867 family)